MQEISELSSLKDINTLYTNFRAEVLVACIVEAGYDPDKIILFRKKGDHAGYLREIESIAIKYPSSNPDKAYLSIQTGRKGIYDGLPEGLFFATSPNKRIKSKESILETMALQRSEEFYIRKTMELYEVEIDRLLVEIKLLELRYDKKSSYNNFANIYTLYWSVLEVMSNEESLRFLMVVPHIHRIRASYDEISLALSFILDVQISVCVHGRQYGIFGGSASVCLYEMRLGQNSILSNTVSESPYIEVKIEELKTSQISSYLEGGAGHKALTELLPLLIDCDLDFQIHIETSPDSRSNRLDSQTLTEVAYLGINTFL